MAEPFVQSASQNLGKLLAEEPNHLQRVEDKVGELQDALDLMLSFLRDADAYQSENEILKRWIEKIIAIAYETESSVEKFIFAVSSKRQEAVVNKLKKYSCISREFKALRDFGIDVNSLMIKIESLTSRLQTYGIESDFIKRKKGRHDLSGPKHLKQICCFAKDDVTFGLDDGVSQIVAQLLKEDVESRVFAICGAAGLGKTVLVKKIYCHDDLRRHFDAFAWAYVPPNCQTREVLRRVLSDLTSRSVKQLAEKTDEDLIKELLDVQHEKRCLIILDAICQNETWDGLKGAFRVSDSRSRLLLTSCHKGVVEHVDAKALIHEPSCLGQDYGWALLQTKLAPAIFANDASKMISLAKQLVKFCQGLPLAISVLGGLLCTRTTYDEWQIVHKKIVSCLEIGKKREKSALAVLLEISYYDLPYYLRPCFLHLATFPDGYEIPTEKIFQIWIADGFIVSPDECSCDGSLEDVAEGYLFELEQRGLVQAGKKGSSGRIKTCYLHNVVRDLCALKAEEHDFLIRILDGNSSEASNSSINKCKRFQRLAMYSHEAMIGLLSSSSAKNSTLRSLIFLQVIPLQEGNSVRLRTLCKQFWFLRVLDLEGADIDDLPRNIGALIHLRYLGVRGTRLRRLPSSIGNLVFLQTLDLRVSLSRVDLMIPNVLWKMERLRHLYLPYYNDEIPNRLNLGNLSHLVTLKNMDIGIFYTTNLLNLTNVKRLSLNNWLSEKDTLKIISKSPSYLSGQLKRLSLRIFGDIFNEDPGLLSHFHVLRRLEIMRRISIPLAPQMLPLNLEVLTLKCCYLEHDPMLILERLPCLRSLFLDWDSFLGTHMICSAGGFPRLVQLKLDSLSELADWRVEEGSMANLKKLEIKYCGKLKKIPDRLPKWVEITCHKRTD